VGSPILGPPAAASPKRRFSLTPRANAVVAASYSARGIDKALALVKKLNVTPEDNDTSRALIGNVVARKETDKGPVGIDDSKCHGLWSVKPIQHCHERSRAPHGLQGTHKTRNGRLPIVAF
jgi:hypothetical protein